LADRITPPPSRETMVDGYLEVYNRPRSILVDPNTAIAV